jgi:hypothetical protein
LIIYRPNASLLQENHLLIKLIIYRPNASLLEENSLLIKLIIGRPNASLLEENSLLIKLIIYRPNADASSTLRERPYRSQESGVIYFEFWLQGFWIVFLNSNLKSKI